MEGRALRRLPPPLPYSYRVPSIPTVLHAPASTIPAPRVVPGLRNLAAPPEFSSRPAPKPPLPPTQRRSHPLPPGRRPPFRRAPPVPPDPLAHRR
jgi:hypothetical protein